MSQRNQRHETEKSFIDDLINNALVKFEQCRILSLSQQDTIARLAKYRINIVATKLEKLLRKKTLDFHSSSSRGQELTPMQKTKFVDELLLLLRMILDITKSYSAGHVETSHANENAEVLSKHTCSQLISTVGGIVFFQSQFQESNNSRALSAACGEIILTISELNEECTLFHVSQLLKQCIEPHAEVRGSFYTLQTLQYIRLKTDGMIILFSLLSSVIDQPTNALNPNFGNWKKSAMLEISAPLRVCILKWLEFDPSAMSSLLISPSSDEDNVNMLALYNKFEPWANGAKRKSAVWPLMCLLLALLPRTFSDAVNDDRKKLSTSRVLRKTIDNLNVSAMRSVLQKDYVLNTELSVISIVLMFKVAASLQRSLRYAVAKSSPSSSLKVYSSSTNVKSETQDELPNMHMNELRKFLMPTVDRVRDLLFSGHHPSHIYYNAITEKVYPCMVTRHTDERDRDHGALCFECEHSQEYLLDTFLWSLFYVDQPMYLQLMTHIHTTHGGGCGGISGSHNSKEAHVSSFARAHSIRSLNSILTSDSVDRAGRSPTWRLAEASAVRGLIIGIIKSYVGQHAQTHGIDDQERVLLSPREDRTEENIETPYKPNRKWTGGGYDSRDRDASKQDTEMLSEVLAIFVDNPWFLYVRHEGDDAEKFDGIIASPFTSQVALVLRDIISIIRFSDDDDLSLRAEEALFALLSVKFIRLWNPSDPFIGVLTVHAVILKHMSYHLLRCRATDGQVTDRLLRCAVQLLKNVNLYLEEDHFLHDVSISTESLRMPTYCAMQQSIWLTEAALLLHLCSAEMDIIQQVMLCFEAWCIHARFVSRIEVPTSGRDRVGLDRQYDSENNDDEDVDEDTEDEDVSTVNDAEHSWKPYYFKIKSPEYAEIFLNYGEMTSSVRKILSQKLQQKSIRSHLHAMPCRTLGMHWALTAVMKRWESFNDIVFKTIKTGIPESSIAAFDEWTNCTGFLCAMGRGLFTNLSPCSIDSLVPYLGGPDYSGYSSKSRSRCSTNSAGSSGCDSADVVIRSFTSTSTCTKLIKQMLFLILIQHTEKRVSFDVFFAIGLSLSPPLIHHLFRELYIILDVMTDVLTKRCDACATTPLESANFSTAKRTKSPSTSGGKPPTSSFIQNFTDFDIFIAEMPLMHVNNFINAILTMLQMIFDREWRKPERDNASMPLSGKSGGGGGASELNEARDSFDDVNVSLSGNQIISLVEKLFNKIIMLESKLHRQLEISDSKSSNILTSVMASATSASAIPTSHNSSASARTKRDNFVLEQFRLRKKMAFMIETFTLQMTPMCKISAALQMKLLSVLMDWVYDCIGYLASTMHTKSAKKSSSSSSGNPSQDRQLLKSRNVLSLVESKENIALYQSTQLACIKAIAAILKGFELIATSEGSEDDPAPPTPATTKSISQAQQKAIDLHKVSKAFYRAFHVLHKLVGTCLNNTDENAIVTRIVTVNAMCNMLHANTGIGLKHMIEAVNSSENQQIRGVLLSVFTETLSRRVDLPFGDDNKPIEESYEDSLLDLLGLLVAPDRELVRLLCAVTRSGKDAGRMSTALLKLFEDLSTSPSASSKSVTNMTSACCVQPDVKLLEWAVQFEVSQTVRLGSLFRSESMSTKLMGTYFTSKGAVYLRHTLLAPIQLFLMQSPSVEVDLHKGAKPEDIPANMARLLHHTEFFLKAIKLSVEECPREMRHILFILKEEATQRFTLESAVESERVAIAGYMFLRFFCPAIAMPSKFDLVGMPATGDDSTAASLPVPVPVLSKQSSRGLLLIAKILQNLANGTHFFEDSMTPLNDWIDGHSEDISEFTASIALLDDSGSAPKREEWSSGAAADLESNVDDGSGSSRVVDRRITSAGTANACGDVSPLNEKQVEMLTTIHSFLYFNNDRIERLLYPLQKVVAPDGQESEPPMSPGIMPPSLSRQTSISRISTSAAVSGGDINSSDSATIDAALVTGPSLGVQDMGSEYMNIRDPLSSLLHKLGEPPEVVPDAVASSTLSGASHRHKDHSGKNSNTSACSVFMTEFESLPDYVDKVNVVRESMIFYSSNLSSSATNKAGECSMPSSNHEVFFFVARRVKSDTDPLALIYFILQELQSFVDFVNCRENDRDEKNTALVPVADLVIDSSSFNADSELPMWSYAGFWSKLNSLVGQSFGSYLRKVYVMYPSVVLLMSTQKILKKWGLKMKTVMERVEVCTPTQLLAKHPGLQEKIPHSTFNIETTSLKHWPAVFQDQYVTITISNSLLLVQSKEKIGGLEFTRTDMLQLHHIESIFKSSNGSSVKSKKHGGDKGAKKKYALPMSKSGVSTGDDKKDADKSKSHPLVVINYTAFHSKRTLKLMFTHTTQFMSALSIALTHVRQQRALEAASESAGTDSLSPEAIPGMLLHIAIANLFSDSRTTRKSSYQLLCQLKDTYELPLLTIPSGSTELSALFMPSNLVHYCVSISSEIASTRPEYGREFIIETFLALKRPVTSQSQKIALILVVAPWIPYLGLYLDYSRERGSVGLSNESARTTEIADEHFSSRTSDQSSPQTIFPDSPHSRPTPTLSDSAGSPVTALGGRKSASSRASSGLIHNSSVSGASISHLARERKSSQHSTEATSSVQMKYDFLGSRIINAKSEDIIQEIENIIEIVISCSSDDEALATVFYLQFWDNVGHLPHVSALAVNYFIKRLAHEAMHHNTVPIATAETGQKKLEGESAPAASTNSGSGGVGSPGGVGYNKTVSSKNKALAAGDQGMSTEFVLESDDILVAPFSMNDIGISSRATAGVVQFGGRAALDAVGKQAFFSQQGDCRYCVTICEAISVLGLKCREEKQQQQQQQQQQQPVILCMLLVDKIKALVEDIFFDEHKDVNIDTNAPFASEDNDNEATTVDFRLDINDTYIKVPMSGGNERNSDTTELHNRFLSVEDQSAANIQIVSKTVNSQLFAGDDSDDDSAVRPSAAQSATAPKPEHDSSSTPNNILSPDKNFRQNLESFFTLPVPPSPYNTPQKQKHAMEAPCLDTAPPSRAPTFIRPPPPQKISSPPASLTNSNNMNLNSKWVEVVSLIRPILYLICQNAIVLEHCTPALLHLCLKLLAKGPRSLRPGVFTLLSSLVHALLSESSDEFDVLHNSKFGACGDGEGYDRRCGRVSRNVDSRVEDEDRLSGGYKSVTDMLTFSGANDAMWKDIAKQVDSPALHIIFNKAPELTSNNFEIVANLMKEVVSCPNSWLSAKWKQSMWDMSLQSSSNRFVCSVNVVLGRGGNGGGGDCGQAVVRASCPVHPSFFYLLGNLIDKDKADAIFFQQILTSLLDVVKICSEFDFVGGNRETQKVMDNIEDKMLRPIVFCLSRSLKFLDFLNLQRLFWCAILLLQFFPEHYLSGPVLLLHSVVEELLLAPGADSCTDGLSQPPAAVEGVTFTTDLHVDNKLVTERRNITSALLTMRQSDDNLKAIFDEVEKSSMLGISFESSFSTAITSTLLRAFTAKEAKTKSLAVDILQKLLQHDQLTYAPPSQSEEHDISTRGVERGVSGYCPILLPHLGLDEFSVSRPFSNALASSSQQDIACLESGVGEALTHKGSAEHDEPASSLSASEKSAPPRLTRRRSVPGMSSGSGSNLLLLSSVLNGPRVTTSVQSKTSFPTYLASLSPSAKAQFVSPSFFGAHNFPTDKSIALFVASLLGYLRLLAQSVYSDEEQQSHAFAFIILLQVLREVPFALHKLYQVIFAELNTTYNLSLQRNHHLADIVLEAIHECLLSQSTGQGERAYSSGTKQGRRGSPPHASEHDTEMGKDSSDIDRVSDQLVLPMAGEDAGIFSDSGSDTDSLSKSPRAQHEEATDMAYLGEIGFSALLCGPYSFTFSRCEKCEAWQQSAAVACPCYTRRRQRKELLSTSVTKVLDCIQQALQNKLE